MEAEILLSSGKLSGDLWEGGGVWNGRMGSTVTLPSPERNSKMKFFFLYYTQCNKTRTRCVHRVPEATSQGSLHPPTNVNPGPSKSLYLVKGPQQPEGREKLG